MVEENLMKTVETRPQDWKMDFSMFQEAVEEIEEMLMIYRSGIREISTKLEILNDDFQVRKQRNPIAYIKSRVKTPKSIYEKLGRKGFEISLKSAWENLDDIGGIRVICPYVDDIYTVADMLVAQDDVTLREKKDYIQNPKENGYRSLHLVLEIPVFFAEVVRPVRVEVQIRTIAMDFWASLEHQLRYKGSGKVTEEMSHELKDCAEVIADTDLRMQHIRRKLDGIE